MDKIRTEYFRRVFRSKLNGSHMIRAINVWAISLSLVSYRARIVKWRKGGLELEALGQTN